MSESLSVTLPSSWYWDEAQYRREIEQIWSREWICVGHRCSWQKPGAYRRVDLGRDQVIVVRDREDGFSAFFNTCRHRGAQLCQQPQGQLRGGRILCPYHAWAYGLDGKLLTAPLSDGVEGFAREQFSLYPVALSEWRGYLFISLSAEPPAAPTIDGAEDLAGWPLEDLEHAHGESHEIACNWKVFWENFMECYHCPGVHPDLCKLVPRYGRMANSVDDLPPDHPLHKDGSPLKEGAVTWSEDGTSNLPWFEGLGQTERDAGMTFAQVLPTMYTVAHVDYVRLVRLLPLEPERTALFIDWMVPPGALEPGVDIERLVSTGRQVVLEDGRICEINQQGLRCSRHAEGRLMPIEYDVLAVQNWVRDKLGEPRCC